MKPDVIVVLILAACFFGGIIYLALRSQKNAPPPEPPPQPEDAKPATGEDAGKGANARYLVEDLPVDELQELFQLVSGFAGRLARCLKKIVHPVH